MTIPFPRRLSLSAVTIASILLALVLAAEGNPLPICVCVSLLVIVGTIAFNLAGGFRSPAGSYVFFCTLFTGVLGSVTKAVLNEPLSENVPNAGTVLFVYLIGTCSMTAAVFASKRLAPKKALLEGKLNSGNTTHVVVGCLAGGILLPYITYLLFSAGAVASIVRQLNIALPLTVLVAVYQRTRFTNGRSSFTWPALLGALYTTFYGLVGFSKEGMFGSWLAWLIAAAAGRLRVTVPQVLTTLAAAFLAIYFLVPIAQYGRNYRVNGGNEALALDLISRPAEIREMVKAKEDEAPPELYHWFRRRQGLLDRLTLVPIDGALIARTDQLGPIGFQNLGNYFINILPHFILPDKAELNTGNQYAHEIGMLAGADHTTGISFSPFAEAYHLGGWLGITVALPGVLIFLFTTIQAVAGTTDSGPWALFFIAAFGHLAAEGSLLFPIYIASFGCEALIATVYFMVYVTPAIGSLLVGPGHVRTSAVRRAVPIPGRAKLTTE